MKIIVSVNGEPELNFIVEGVGPKFWSGAVVWKEKKIGRLLFSSKRGILWRLQTTLSAWMPESV